MKICSIEDCQEKAGKNGLCTVHLRKAYYAANRDKIIAEARAWQAANQERFMEGQRAYKANNKERVRAVEKASYERRVSSPRFMNGESITTAEVTYIGAHRRVQLNRGRASLYECVCGKPAAQWAHNHSQNEFTRQEPKKDQQGVLKTLDYSLNVWDYIALCKGCHMRFDKTGFLMHDYEVVE